MAKEEGQCMAQATGQNGVPHFDKLVLSPRYLKAQDGYLRKHPQHRGRVRRVLERYLTDLQAVDRTLIHNPRYRIYHSSISDSDRLVDLPVAGNGAAQTILLNVGHHEVVEWAAHYAGDPQQELANARELRPRGSTGTHRRAVPQPSSDESTGRSTSRSCKAKPGTYGEYLPYQVIRRLVGDEMAQTVFDTRTTVPLVDAGIDQDVADQLETMFINLLPAEPVQTPVPQVGSAPAIEITADEVPTLLRIPLVKFLATVTEEQRRLIQRPPGHLMVVKGAAGTGKTIVGVRRIEWLLSQPGLFAEPKPILYVCYNQVLRQAVLSMLEDILPADPPWHDRVVVTTAWSLMGKLAHSIGGNHGPKLLAGQQLVPLVHEARQQVQAPTLRSQRLSDRYVLDEICEVILAFGLHKESEYISSAQKRTGRGIPLYQVERKYIWEVFEEFNRRCITSDIAPYEWRPWKLAADLPFSPEPTYQAVVVDEAQDLPPAVFRCLLRLQAGQENSFMVLGDVAQNVYRAAFRWADTGLHVAGGHVTILRTCYRTTRPILEAALPLVERQRAQLGEDLVLPEADPDGADGPMPTIYRAASEEDELKFVTESVWDEVANGTPPPNIAVFADDRQFLHRVAAGLGELGLPYELFEKPDGKKGLNLADPSVKLITTYSAKGLEFPIVFLAQVTRRKYWGWSNEAQDQARRRLYTAMLRAAWRLTLSTVECDASPLLDELRLGERAIPNGGPASPRQLGSDEELPF